MFPEHATSSLIQVWERVIWNRCTWLRLLCLCVLQGQSSSELAPKQLSPSLFTCRERPYNQRQRRPNRTCRARPPYDRQWGQTNWWGVGPNNSSEPRCVSKESALKCLSQVCTSSKPGDGQRQQKWKYLTKAHTSLHWLCKCYWYSQARLPQHDLKLSFIFKLLCRAGGLKLLFQMFSFILQRPTGNETASNGKVI